MSSSTPATPSQLRLYELRRFTLDSTGSYSFVYNCHYSDIYLEEHMTDTEILIEVAKLDGWLDVKEYELVYDYAGDKGKFKQLMGRNPDNLGELKCLLHYLTSRDAIIPVIEKCGMKGVRGDCYYFGERLIEELSLSYTVKQPCDVFYLAESIVQATPKQLCIALLKATGKWKD